MLPDELKPISINWKLKKGQYYGVVWTRFSCTDLCPNGKVNSKVNGGSLIWCIFRCDILSWPFAFWSNSTTVTSLSPPWSLQTLSTTRNRHKPLKVLFFHILKFTRRHDRESSLPTPQIVQPLSNLLPIRSYSLPIFSPCLFWDLYFQVHHFAGCAELVAGHARGIDLNCGCPQVLFST